MAVSDTEVTVRNAPDAEAIFAEFVRNANDERARARTAAAAAARKQRFRRPVERRDEDTTATGRSKSAGRVYLLTSRKTPLPSRSPLGADEDSVAEVVSLPSPDTQRREAALIVPDVAAVRPPPRPVPERSEDGHIPAGELDRILSDMQVLLRYGNAHQVRTRLDELCRRYPNDLLLLRRVAEFHLETEQKEAALDVLFTLSARFFERRNVEGMRKALEQVLVLEPDNKRAVKLLGLLEQRTA